MASGGIRRAGSGLSAPASRVRTTSGRPSSATAIRLQRLRLLLFAGQFVAIQKQELGPQQPDALGPELDGPRSLAGGAEVGEHLERGYRLALPRARRARERASCGSPVLTLGALSRGVELSDRRLDLNRSAVAVDQQASHRFAIASAERADADDRGKTERPGDDRRVGRRGAARCHDSGDERGVEGGGVGGCELVADDDPMWRLRLVLAVGQGEQNPAADVEDVGRPLCQQRVGQGAVDADEKFRSVVDRSFGGGPRRDRGPCGLQQRLVVQQRQVGVEDRRLVRPGSR